MQIELRELLILYVSVDRIFELLPVDLNAISLGRSTVDIFLFPPNRRPFVEILNFRAVRIVSTDVRQPCAANIESARFILNSQLWKSPVRNSSESSRSSGRIMLLPPTPSSLVTSVKLQLWHYIGSPHSLKIAK